MFKQWTRNLLLRIASFVNSDSDSKVLFYHDIHDQTPYCDFSTPLDMFKMCRNHQKANFEIVRNISV